MSRGYIIPIGGAEAKITGRDILRRFVEVCGGEEAWIAVIPTASSLADIGAKYEAVFGDLGARRVTTLPFQERADCHRRDWLGILEQVTGVFMTGGNQLRLATTLGGSPVADLLRRRNLEGLPIAGTSAGAAFMSEHMIAHGKEGMTPRSDMVQLVPGLGLTALAIIDQHFRQRDRLGRLITALAFNPRPIGIGLDEDTAAFLAPGGALEVVGSGAITVLDPADVEYSSMDSAKPHDPVCVIGVRLHVLTAGASFHIETRKATPPQAVAAPPPQADRRAKA